MWGTFLNAWWFHHRSVDGKGYVTTKSKGLDEVLSHKNLQYLLRFDASASNERPQTFFVDDKVVVVSYVKYVDDDMHRSSIYHYGLVMYWWDYFKFQGAEKFEPYFIKEDMSPPKERGALNII